MKQRHVFNFPILAIVTSLALGACAFESSGATLGIELFIPEYAAFASANARTANAKLLSPAIATVRASVSYDDGSSKAPVEKEVVAGTTTIIEVSIRLDLGGTIRIDTFDASRALLTSGDIPFGPGASGSLRAAMKPSLDAVSDMTGTTVAAGSTFNGNDGKSTDFFRFTSETSGYFLVAQNDFDPCWIGAFDAETGAALPGPASDRADGWVVFKAEANKPFIVAVASPVGEINSDTIFTFRDARFVSASALAPYEGTMERPYRSISSIRLDGEGQDETAYLLSGSYQGYLPIELNGALIGGYSADFESRGETTEISSSSGMPILTSNDMLHDLLIEDLQIIGAQPDQSAFASTIQLENPSGNVVVRDSVIKIPDCSSSNANMAATVSAIALLGGANLIVRNTNIEPADVASGQSIATIAGILVNAGNLDVEGCDIVAADINASAGIQALAAAIVVKGSGDVPYSGAVRIVGNWLDGGNAGRPYKRVQGITMAGVYVLGANTYPSLVVARNHIYAGNAFLNESPAPSSLMGIAAGYAEIGEDMVVARITNNVVSGGLIDGIGIDEGTRVATIGVYYRFRASDAGISRIDGNTIASGSIASPFQEGAILQSIGINYLPSGGLPVTAGNVVICAAGEGNRYGVWSMSKYAFASCHFLRNAFWLDGAQTALLGDPTNPQVPVTTLATSVAVNEYSNDADNPDGNLDMPSADWFESIPSAATSATALVGAWRPSAAAREAFANGAAALQGYPEDNVDIDGRTRPAMGFWSIGAYQR
jgi:hypothetical protein